MKSTLRALSLSANNNGGGTTAAVVSGQGLVMVSSGNSMTLREVPLEVHTLPVRILGFLGFFLAILGLVAAAAAIVLGAEGSLDTQVFVPAGVVVWTLSMLCAIAGHRLICSGRTMLSSVINTTHMETVGPSSSHQEENKGESSKSSDEEKENK